jgi:hypothetical protein
MPFILLLYYKTYILSLLSSSKDDTTNEATGSCEKYIQETACHESEDHRCSLPATVHFLAATGPRGILLFRRTKSQASAGL